MEKWYYFCFTRAVLGNIVAARGGPRRLIIATYVHVRVDALVRFVLLDGEEGRSAVLVDDCEKREVKGG